MIWIKKFYRTDTKTLCRHKHYQDNARSANLANSIMADNAAQTQTLISSLLPRPVPAYPSASPYMAYNWSNYFNNGGCPYNNI